jgi:tetratricopeptide (TPR) repeat protein
MGRFTSAIIAISLLVSVTGWTETNTPPSEAELALQRNIAALQEQQQATLRAIEQARQDAAAAAKKSAADMEARLNQIETNVTEQRTREVESLQTAHRYTLTVVGIVAVGGFLSMLAVALFLLRSLNRRTSLAAPLDLSVDSLALAGLDPAQQSSARFRASLSQLEQRLNELEGTTQGAELEAGEELQAGDDSSSHAALLLGKGQALLNLQQAGAALACFEQVIATDATNAEAFVKKGTALEKLDRLDEAIDCYDQAIALDTTMTMAYLCKGGVFNRLERYGEALQCYEQALHAQQKTGVA